MFDSRSIYEHRCHEYDRELTPPQILLQMSGYQYLSEEGFRVDGRRAQEMRKLDCSLGVFAQADGTAYVKQGNTVVLAAVYGPHEVRGGRVKVRTTHL